MSELFEVSGLLVKDKKNIWHPFTPLVTDNSPILIERGEGASLFTHDGREIIDAVSSWWVNLHGHSNPRIVEAISRQASHLEHVIFAGFTHAPAINLAERILKILPQNQIKLFFSDDGSTAVEVSIKMALQYWFNKNQPKKKIIALEGAYHGDTFGAMSVADRGPFNEAFQSHLFEVDFIPFPTADNFEGVKHHFLQLTESKEVAAFIFEPLLQGAAGMRIYPPSLLDNLLEIAKENEVLTIADEVLTGFGRTGKLFASLYLKNQPDIICLSKGITGGFMALGATTCNERVISAFDSPEKSKTFYHGHSYTGNPIACAAGNASLDILLDLECQGNIRRINEKHLDFIKTTESAKIKDIRCIGTVLAIELYDEKESSYFSSIRTLIYSYFMERNILLRPLGNVIYILPPYVITNDQLERIYGEIKNFINKIS